MSLTDMTGASTDLAHSLRQPVDGNLLDYSLADYTRIVQKLAEIILTEIGLSNSDLLATAKIGALWDAVIAEHIGSDNRQEFQLLSIGLLLYKRWHVQSAKE